MKRNTSRTTVFTEDVAGLECSGTRNRAAVATVPDCARPPRDRWLGDLIQMASPSGPVSSAPRLASPDPSMMPPPAGLPERLQQAVRWGSQERDFARFEASLSRPATFGEYVRWTRERSGRTPEQIGDQAGVGAESIRALEGGYLSPLEVPAEQVADLTHALDASIWTVLERIHPAGCRSNPGGAALLLSAPTAPYHANGVWSNGATRGRDHMQPLSHKPPTPPSKHEDLAEYRRAVYTAWRQRRAS